MFEEANRDIAAGIAQSHRRKRELRLETAVRAIDALLFQLEELNLQGVDRVPSALRERASLILEGVPVPADDAEREALRLRYRVVPLMDVLFLAQEMLFRARDPERAHDLDEDALVS
ncbi:MAG TPA: hypothetical protein VF134_06390 [Candidatus Dormibacteraeota bacterium]